MNFEKFKELHYFFSSVEILEENQENNPLIKKITYKYNNLEFKLGPIHYSEEDIYITHIQKVENREVHDMYMHEWPDDTDNTEAIKSEMVELLENKKLKNEFFEFLSKAKEKIEEVFDEGRSQRWPVLYLLNNNHWHDIISLAKYCLEKPQYVLGIINNYNIEDRIDCPVFKNLIYRWNKSQSKDIREAFHGNYQFIRLLLENAVLFKKKLEEETIMKKNILLLENIGQLVLYGPPGTGKTYFAKQLAVSIVKDNPFNDDPKKTFNELRTEDSEEGKPAQVEIVQFHPSYNYEDFVRGIQVSTDDNVNIQYKTKDKILVQMAKYALNSKENKEEKKYVLIIDEINRANLAAVLGELIYALEYRGEKVRTPYSVNDDYEITIPDNLYILGTMNTADRSVGHIDYAVRRRFVFVPCLADRSVLENYYADNNTSHLRDTALELFDAVAALFSKTGTGDNQHNQGYLAPDFFKDDVQIGHTYFMAKDCEELAMKFAYQVYPLLREYYKDGILVSGNEKIEIKIDQEQNGDHPLRLDNPEDCQAIFDRIVRKCQEKEKSVSEGLTQSEEDHQDSQDPMSQEDSGQESDSQ